MIERVLIDNFRCFVNFDWRPGRIALLLGENGTGKSALAEAVWGIAALATTSSEVRRVFPATALTRWDKRRVQSFGLDVRLAQGLYAYRLTVEHHPTDRTLSRVQKEVLLLDTQTLMSFEMGELQLYRDDGSKGPSVTGAWAQSGLGAIAPGRDNLKLSEFKRWLLEDLWFLKPDPRRMSSRTDEEGERLETDLANFSSWYAPWVASDLGAAHAATEALRAVLPGFKELKVHRNAPLLGATFEAGREGPYGLLLEDLSDGQRQLVALYVLRHAIVRSGRTIMLDEPDNYLSLREVQPWLMEIVDTSLREDGPQVWIVSHHSEILNLLAPEYGAVFVRAGGGPVRVEGFPARDGLTPAEVVARGLDDV